MVDSIKQIVYMGSGDVAANFSVVGTKEEPRGIITFQTMQQADHIEVLPDDYEPVIDPEQTELLPIWPAITLSFSSPESIDAIISVLKYVKKITFEDIEMRDKILDLPLDEMRERQQGRDSSSEEEAEE